MVRVSIPQDQVSCENWIAGQWRRGSGETLDIQSPITGETIGSLQVSTKQDLTDCIENSQEAAKGWAARSIKERCAVMFRAREILLRECDVISHVVSAESGKTFGESKAGLLKGIEVLEYALSLQNLDSGGRMEVSTGVCCEYRREPLGVVAGITPFNFPAMVPMWMMPIALTLGNAFIWKPSEKTPITSKLLAGAFHEAGLPSGVLNIVQGGRETVESILDAPGIAAAAFVGSTAVAKQVYARGSASHKRVLALGGAKNHIVLMPDADPEMAADGILASFTGCAGQRCMAASVLLAVGDTDHIISKIKERAGNMKLADNMGAIITRESVDRLNQAVDSAESAGSKIILDGRRPEAPEDYENGFWFGPTMLDECAPDAEVSRTELFGPVLTIIRCKNLSEALAIENSSEYGNAASVFTQSGAVAERFAQEAQAGMVGVNIGVPVPREPFSFGGIQASKFGQGDITGAGSLDFWSNQKKLTTKWSSDSARNWMS